jgi:futalosine hydrolase
VRILLVCATALEIAPLASTLTPRAAKDERQAAYSHNAHDLSLLITGVGMVATAARTSRALAESRYDLALNFGVCGSFDSALPPGAVVHVTADCLPELGAEDGEAFVPVQRLGLLGDDEPPFTGGRLVNAAPPDNAALRRLPSVRGITVNTVHGGERSIADVVARVAPQVESMEGAAFMYACLIHEVRFAQVRAVSNRVERRNRDAWQIGDAVDALCRTARELLDHV